METIDNLQEHLASAREKEQRLSERAGKARTKLAHAEAAYERGVEESSQSAADAIFEERDIATAALSKKAAESQRKVQEAQSELEACTLALERQTSVVQSIAGEINTRKHELFARELAPARTHALEKMQEFANAAIRLREIAGKHGVGSVILATELFPWWTEDFQDVSARAAYCGLLTAAIGLHDYLAKNYGRSLAGTAGSKR